MSFERILSFFKRSGVEPRTESDILDMRGHVRAAYELLINANKKAIQIPADVVEVITSARRINTPDLPVDLEARFWNAYGLLSSSIRPAERARTFYRNTFYVILLILLCGQFFFLAGDSVRSKLAELDKKIVEIRGVAASPAVASPQTLTQQQVDQRISQLESSQKAYHALGRNLVNLVGLIADIPLGPFGFKSFFSIAPNEDPLIVQGKLELLLIFLSGYLLPMLYGLLGACAFVLRKLSDEIDKLTYANDTRVRYGLRLNIGLLAGLAVGWFIKPGVGDPTLVSLSPLALAFVAGYGSDLVFYALDKIVQAFSPSSGSSDATVRDITTGGLRTRTIELSETHVAGEGGRNEITVPETVAETPPRRVE